MDNATMDTASAIVAFDPKELTNYGNQMLSVIVQHEDARDAAERAIAQAGEREKVIDFELTRVALHLHNEEKIDLYAIYDDNRETSTRLYRSILIETGTLVKRIDEDTDKVLYDFTDEAIKGKFDFSEELKEKDEAEYKKRRSRRNALNIRLARVCKAALALHEAGSTTDNMQIAKDEETGELNAVITKGPAEVMGKEGTVQVHSKSVSPVEGATVTPTITGLAKFSDSKHKEAAKPASKAKTESSNREQGSSADFAATLNAAIMVVKALEGNADKAQIALMKNLLTELTPYVK